MRGDHGLDAPEAVGQQVDQRLHDGAVQAGRDEALVESGEPLRRMLGIAAQELVRPLPGQHHLHALCRLAREEIDRDIGRLGNGCIAMVDQLRQVLHQILGRNQKLAMARGELASHQAGIGQLRIAGLAEADGEGVDRLGGMARHQGDDRGAIDTAGEKGPIGDVAHHPNLDGRIELAGEGIDGIGHRLARSTATGHRAAYRSSSPSAARAAIGHSCPASACGCRRRGYGVPEHSGRADSRRSTGGRGRGACPRRPAMP